MSDAEMMAELAAMLGQRGVDAAKAVAERVAAMKKAEALRHVAAAMGDAIACPDDAARVKMLKGMAAVCSRAAGVGRGQEEGDVKPTKDDLARDLLADLKAIDDLKIVHPGLEWFVNPRTEEVCHGDPDDDGDNYPLDDPGEMKFLALALMSFRPAVARALAAEAEARLLREAAKWAAGFIRCNFLRHADYPDYHNLAALAEGGEMHGPFNMMRIRAEVAEALLERLVAAHDGAAGESVYAITDEARELLGGKP